MKICTYNHKQKKDKKKIKLYKTCNVCWLDNRQYKKEQETKIFIIEQKDLEYKKQRQAYAGTR